MSAYSFFNRRKQTIAINNAEERFTLSGPCVFTGKHYSVTGDLDGLNRWFNGELVQRCFPDMSADDREFIISGISPAGWQQEIANKTDNDGSSD